MVRYLSDDVNALDCDPVHDLSSADNSDNDLSNGVRYNFFSEASIVSDCHSTNSVDCEIENANMVNP